MPKALNSHTTVEMHYSVGHKIEVWDDQRGVFVPDPVSEGPGIWLSGQFTDLEKAQAHLEETKQDAYRVHRVGNWGNTGKEAKVRYVEHAVYRMTEVHVRTYEEVQ